MSLVTEEHRAIIIVKADKLTSANNSAASWDPDTAGDETFGTTPGLSSDGTEPASHYAANTALTDAMRTEVLDAADNVPLVEVYFASDGWDWQSALADQGLERIQVEV